MLKKAGFQLDKVREIVAKTADAREEHGPVPALWRLEKPISQVGKRAGFLYLLGVAVLIRLLMEGACVSKR